MKYRILPKSKEKISIIGLGAAYIHEGSTEETDKTLNMAIDNGINYFDMAPAVLSPYESYARAFEGRRNKVMTQMHFGAYYKDGTYGWTRDLKTIKDKFQWELNLLKTDYTDFGFIHCIDELDDLDKVMNSGIWDYMKSEKSNGRIRHLGFSTHSPEIAYKLLDTGYMDLFMFSINPAYDYTKGKYALGSVEERSKLYQEAEKEGIGITVMKPFGGGQLLNEKTSPFRRALTKNQCIQYALDRPSVMNVLPGVSNRKELKEVLGFVESSEDERDYSVVGEFTPQDAVGNCVYCNHCQPCPMKIDVGMINKYYDLAKAGDVLAEGHYDKLSVKADACTSCGHCVQRCPFNVDQIARMKEIENYFSK